MDLNDFGQYTPLIAIAVSLITLVMGLVKYLGKKWNESLDSRIEGHIGEKIHKLEGQYAYIVTKLEVLYDLVVPSDLKHKLFKAGKDRNSLEDNS